MPISPSSKKLLDERGLEHALLVHLLHVGPDRFIGELADGVAKQNFVFGQAH